MTIKALLAPAVLVMLAMVSLCPANGEEAAVAVDTSGLKPIGPDWVSENPYRGNKRAIEIGTNGYNQNCARCHGLDVKSGGFNPDLRYLPTGEDGDTLFLMRMTSGAQKNGRILMPKFDGVLPQELLWAIRTYIEAQHVDN